MRPGQPGAAEPSSGTLLTLIWRRRSSAYPGPGQRNPPLWSRAPGNKRGEIGVGNIFCYASISSH